MSARIGTLDPMSKDDGGRPDADEITFPGPVTKGITVSKRRDIRAWIGTTEHLIAMEREVTQAVASAFEANKATIGELSGLERKWAVESHQVQTRVFDNEGVIYSEPLADALKHLRHQDICGIEVKNGGLARTSLVRVEMGTMRKKLFTTIPAGSIEVNGDDKRWVDGTLRRLEIEAKKNRPRWALLATTPGVPFIGIILFLIFLVGTNLATGSYTDLHWSVLIIAAIFCGLLANILLHTVLRTFQLHDPGGRTKPAAFLGVMAWVLGLLLAILGIIYAQM